MNTIKIGRNDPYRCDSGQEHKRCCLEKYQRAESAALLQTPPARQKLNPPASN